MTLQQILKLKGSYNLKTRVRKFKARVLKSHVVKFSNKGRAEAQEAGSMRYIVRADKSCTIGYLALVGLEKALMFSKNAFVPIYRDYPRFFVTAKSSKSRMGKGKGKIKGRIQKVIKNQVLFEFDLNDSQRAQHFIKCMRSALPVTVSMIEPRHYALSALDSFYRWRRRKHSRALVATGKKAIRRKHILKRQQGAKKKRDYYENMRFARKLLFFPRKIRVSRLYCNVFHNYLFPYKSRRHRKWPKRTEVWRH